MHRIDGPGATTENLFTEGDPTQGVPATSVTGGWLNAVQEEIAHVIEGAGTPLSKVDNHQLLTAIYTIAGRATGWTTGDVKLTIKTSADDGWLMCNDGTIGPAGSAATARAHQDTRSLFILLWNGVGNAGATVSGGRGSSAVADLDSGKVIGLTKMLDRALGVAGGGASLTSRLLGEVLGAETHTLTAAQMPSHTHTGTTVASGAHKHDIPAKGSDGSATNDTTTLMYGTTKTESNFTSMANSATHTHTFTTASAGTGAEHNIMQPTTFLNVMIKL